MALNLLGKTEFWIENVTLNKANLTQIAGTVANVLHFDPQKVLVVDVRPDHITLDILEDNIDENHLIGKEHELINAVGKIDGVNTTSKTSVHSNGVLGLICLQEDSQKVSANVSTITDEILRNISKRAIVFPTGFELKQGLIEDTNTPFIKNELEKEGYKVTVGPIMEDDPDDVEFKLSDAVSRAFGLIITTGGVGAEDKDKTVESILRIDPEAATPYIVKFHKGIGRHVKEGVRIAVGKIGPSYIIAFPGPNDEVKMATKALLQSLKAGYSKGEIANSIASVLSQKLMN